MVLRRRLAIGLVLAGVCGIAAARADNYPVIVVPGRPGVPVIINGRDASWAVVNGDWGLYRPGAVTVTVIYPRPWLAVPDYRYVRRYRPMRRHIVVRRGTSPPAVHTAHGTAYVPPSERHYYPGGTVKPQLGRLEIEPKGPHKPAESFFRYWSTESAAPPADIAPPAPVIIAPMIGRRGRPRLPPPQTAPVPAAGPH